MTFSLRKTIRRLGALALFWSCILTLSSAAAVGPPEAPAPKEAPAKEEAPTTCGPLISDSCLPIEKGKSSLQFLWAYGIVRANATPNWRQVSAKGDFSTCFMPVKFAYGMAKNLEMYVIVPYIHNFAGNVSPDLAGPQGQRSADFGGVGDITLVGKYLLLPETESRPAVTGVLGTGFPSGHASHLNPRFLGQDAIGTGAFTFTTGVNLHKWLKPFLVYSNIWFNAPVNLYPDRPDTVRSREFMTFNVAAEYPITKKWVALLECYSTWTWTNISTPQGFQSPATVMGVLPGIEYFITEKWAVSTGAAFDLAGKATALKITPLFTLYRNF